LPKRGTRQSMSPTFRQVGWPRLTPQGMAT
jgi:hypothetical protein